MPKSPCYRVVTPVGSKSTLNHMIRVHSKQMVRCPTCLESLSLEDYVRKHAMERHGWNRLRVCIYCSGGACWPLRKRNFKHIVPCLKRFLKGNVPIDEPQSKELQPSEECHKFSPILLSHEEWYARQMMKGNTLTSISSEPYVLCPGQQNVMKQIKIALEQQEETDKRIREEMCRVYDARIADLKRETRILKSENVDLRQKMTTEFADMRQKMTALEAENANLRQSMRAATILKADNVDLRHKIQTLKGMLLHFTGAHNQGIANFVNQI